MAIEVLRVLTENGIDVPEQVKVIGFDDIPQAATSNPPLSSIQQPSFQLGQKVAEQLLQHKDIKLSNIELPITVIARLSSL